MSPLAVTLAALAAAAGPAPARAPEPPRAGEPRTLRVMGEGRAGARPDVLLVRLGAAAVDRSLSAATRDVSRRVERITGALRTAGVAQRDLQTSALEVGLERRQDERSGEPQVTGYRAVNMVSVKLRDLERAGSIIDAALAAGANELQSVGFALDDPAAARAQARAAAVADAQSRAEALAKHAGVGLGRVLRIDEAPSGPGPIAVSALRAAGGVPVERGEVEVLVQVEMVYALR
jgi:uncharacterized protein YggE